MVVKNIGYKKLEDLKVLIENNQRFQIYKTSKNTQVLILDVYSGGDLHTPDMGRVEWNIVEGKRICGIRKTNIVFDSATASLDEIDLTKWNNGNQILCYIDYYFYHTNRFDIAKGILPLENLTTK